MADYSFDMKVGDLLDDDKSRQLLEEYLPEVVNNPQISMARDIKFKDMLNFAKGKLDQEKIDAFEEELKNL